MHAGMTPRQKAIKPDDHSQENRTGASNRSFDRCEGKKAVGACEWEEGRQKVCKWIWCDGFRDGWGLIAGYLPGCPCCRRVWIPMSHMTQGRT